MQQEDLMQDPGTPPSHHLARLDAISSYMDASPMARLRPVWVGTGCTSIFGLFVQDYSCWPRWNQPTRASFLRKGFPLAADSGLADRGLTCLPSHLLVPAHLQRAGECIHWPDDLVRP